MAEPIKRHHGLRVSLPVILIALFASWVSVASARQTSGAAAPRLEFAYDASAPLGYRDRGRINPKKDQIAVNDVSFTSGGKKIQGYLVQPSGKARLPAVVFVAGGGADRRDLLGEAAWLAERRIVALTITPPSTAVKTAPATGPALLEQAKSLTVNDVVAVRRAVDVLRTLPTVDKTRIGYVGWSLGGKTGTFVAASEPRVKALVLLSAGADQLSAFVASAPPSLRAQAQSVLGSVDPIRYIAFAKPGSVLLEDGTKDEVVPKKALLNIANAAPKGTELRWYDAPHALDATAYQEAFAWLAKKLSAK
jgi:dienelactone hydrolase